MVAPVHRRCLPQNAAVGNLHPFVVVRNFGVRHLDVKLGLVICSLDLESVAVRICSACAAGVKRSADPGFSLLAVCALQQALKVACSSKLPSESRTWISAYTAAVLSQLLRTQLDPQPLCHLIIGLFCQAAVSKPAADTAQHAQQLTSTQSSNPAEHAVLLSLPSEAQTLAALFTCSQGLLQCWQSLGRTANPRQQQQPHQQGTSPGNLSEGSKPGKRHQPEGRQLDSVKKRQKHEAVLAASSPAELNSPLQVLRLCLLCYVYSFCICFAAKCVSQE